MIDLSQFIQKYTLQREQLDIAQHIVSRTEFRAHAWTDGKKVEYREGDIEIAYPKEKEMDWLMPWIMDCCADYSDKFGNVGTFTSKISYPGRFNKYNPGSKMDPHYDFVRYIFDGNQKGIPIFSIVLLINDECEGGELIFKLGGSNVGEIYKPEVQAGDMLIFPSGFLFEHWVEPVTSGERYSLVHWAY